MDLVIQDRHTGRKENYRQFELWLQIGAWATPLLLLRDEPIIRLALYRPPILQSSDVTRLRCKISGARVPPARHDATWYRPVE